MASSFDTRRSGGALLFGLLLLRPHFSGPAYPFLEALFAMGFLMALGLLHSGSPSRSRSPPCVLPLVLFAWAALSLLWSRDPGQGLREAVTLLGGLLAMACAVPLAAAIRPGRLLLLGALTLGPVAARAFHQRIWGFPALRETLREMAAAGQDVSSLARLAASDRAFAGFLNPNLLAAFAALWAPLLLALALSQKGKARIGAAALLLTCGLVLVLAGSLGGTLVSLGGCLLVLVLQPGGGRLVVPGAIAAGALAVSILITRGTGFLLGPDSSILQRLGYWKAGWDAALAHPWAGWGMGSMPAAMAQSLPAGLRPAADPHSFLLKTWGDWGFAGLFLLGGVLFLAARAGWKRPGALGDTPLEASLLASLAAFLLHSSMDMTFSAGETAVFGWVLIGALIGRTREDAGPRLRVPAAVPFILLGTLFLALIPVLEAEVCLRRGKEAVRAGDAVTAAEQFRAARRRVPFLGEAFLLEGNALAVAGRTAEARRAFLRAADLMPASSFPPWELGKLSLAEGRDREAADWLARAHRAYPHSPRILLDYAVAEGRAGNRVEAASLLRKALANSVFDPESRKTIRELLVSGAFDFPGTRNAERGTPGGEADGRTRNAEPATAPHKGSYLP